ncbi:two-component system, OmpR family, phosphate regulon response regulator PhoB [Bradyrhizobium sp. Gha]|nr:two-component system, OmpR family, phosphate regulon response regulator PhoB [Bradyrhizobium sp. Gha]
MEVPKNQASKQLSDGDEQSNSARVACSRDHLEFLDVVMDVRTQRVSRSGRPIKMRPVEFRLLQYFLEHPQQVFSRAELLSSIWGQHLHVVSRTVDVHVGRLRKALNKNGQPNCIRTVHSRGYSLDAQD